MSDAFTFKEKAVFAEDNRERIRGIITSDFKPEDLARIPPSFIVIDLTWKCNYKCIGCVDEGAINRKDSAKLSLDLIEDIFDYSKEHGVRGIMTMGGEVFTYRAGIKKALEKSIQHNIPLKTVTNGSLLGNYLDDVIEAYKIPGSVLRISINAGRADYAEQVGVNYSLDKIFSNIKYISSKGVPVFVSTVVFPQESRQDGFLPNIDGLYEIVEGCEESGVSTHLLLPARSPTTKKRYDYSDHEKGIIRGISMKPLRMMLVSGDITREEYNSVQNMAYSPCPSGFIFTLVGSDGNLYKCTDNRGRDSAIIGKIKKRGDFDRVWHSEERVKRQLAYSCENQGCTRYNENAILNAAMRLHREYGPDITKYLVQDRESHDSIFV
ncbi:MAG: radical SAM protein [Candidatus Woesearchaeota archaeon]|nr:radical SAM protein [Candidatus Woesearchaeota archaeon]